MGELKRRDVGELTWLHDTHSVRRCATLLRVKLQLGRPLMALNRLKALWDAGW